MVHNLENFSDTEEVWLDYTIEIPKSNLVALELYYEHESHTLCFVGKINGTLIVETRVRKKKKIKKNL